MRKLVPVFAVGLLVVLAGCAGLAGQTGDPMLDDDESVEDFKTTHADALDDAGSYTVALSIEREQGDQASVNEYSYIVDSDSDRAFSSVVQSGESIEMYTEGDTTYIQRKSDVSAQDANYEADSEPYETETVQPVSIEQSTMANSLLPVGDISHYESGVETYDGVEVTVYKADEGEAIEAVEESMGENSQVTVESFSSTLYVDANGIVRYQEVSYELSSGEQFLDATMTLEITDVGQTTLEEPSWIEEAKSQTQIE